MSAQNRLHSIQILRGLAALSVVIDHAMTRRGASLTTDEPLFWQFGSFGVSVFFAISGFVMIHSLDGFAPTWPGAMDFIERRLKRIVPLYWIATLTALLLLTHRPVSVPITTVLKSFLFIAAPSISDDKLYRPIVGQGWTLNYEIFFYIIFSLAMLLPRRLTAKGVIITLILFSVVGVLIRGSGDNGDARTFFQFYTDPVILLFGAGILIGLLRRHAHREWCGPIAAGLAYLVFLTVVVTQFVVAGSPLEIGPATRLTSAILASACVLIAAMEIRQERPGWHVSVVEHFGNASYSVYLFHQFTFSVTGRILTLACPKAPAVVVAMVLIAGACAFGSLAHVVIEKPLMRALAKMPLFRARKSAQIIRACRNLRR